MKITKREQWALWQLLEFPIHRYLIANSCQRLDGAEKVQRHIEISKIIAGFLYCADEDDDIITDTWISIHNTLADILTDRMDEVIGFPINEPLSGNDMYDPLAEKFFNVIIKNMGQIESKIKNNSNS